jgi:stage III sporulation protein AD
MEAEILKIIGVAIMIAVLAFVFKELKKEYAAMILIAGGIFITVWSLSYVFPVISYLHEITGSNEISEYFNIILKVLGISFIVQIGADICRDLGEASLASKVEFAGKAAILVMIMPILRSVLGMGFDLLR